MLKSWAYSPEDRPSFRTILDELESLQHHDLEAELEQAHEAERREPVNYARIASGTVSQ